MFCRDIANSTLHFRAKSIAQYGYPTDWLNSSSLTPSNLLFSVQVSYSSWKIIISVYLHTHIHSLVLGWLSIYLLALFWCNPKNILVMNGIWWIDSCLVKVWSWYYINVFKTYSRRRNLLIYNLQTGFMSMPQNLISKQANAAFFKQNKMDEVDQ